MSAGVEVPPFSPLDPLGAAVVRRSNLGAGWSGTWSRPSPKCRWRDALWLSCAGVRNVGKIRSVLVEAQTSPGPSSRQLG